MEGVILLHGDIDISRFGSINHCLNRGMELFVIGFCGSFRCEYHDGWFQNPARFVQILHLVHAHIAHTRCLMCRPTEKPLIIEALQRFAQRGSAKRKQRKQIRFIQRSARRQDVGNNCLANFHVCKLTLRECCSRWRQIEQGANELVVLVISVCCRHTGS